MTLYENTTSLKDNDHHKKTINSQLFDSGMNEYDKNNSCDASTEHQARVGSGESPSSSSDESMDADNISSG